MTIGGSGATGDDGHGIDEVVIQQPVIDGGADPFGCQWLAFMDEHAVGAGAGGGDQFTGSLDGSFGDALGLAQVIDFLGRFLPAFVHPSVWITFYGDASLTCEVGKNEWQGAVAGHAGDSGAAEAFRRGLGVGRFAVSRKPSFRRVVGRAGDAVDAG